MTGLARTRLTPTALTVSGVLLCIAAACSSTSSTADHLLYYWLGAAVFVVGSVLDILDGALARAGGRATPFGAFIDSTTDRIGEAFMLGSIGLVFAREGNETALAFTFAAVAGSFLVSYTRARAEALGLKGDVGFGSRAERVIVITVGLVIAPWGGLQWAIYLLAATAWITVVQRIWSVRKQLNREEHHGFHQRLSQRPRALAGQGARRDHRRRQLRQLARPGRAVLQGCAGRVRPGPDARRPRRLPHQRHRVHGRVRRRQGQGRQGPRRRDLGEPERHEQVRGRRRRPASRSRAA